MVFSSRIRSLSCQVAGCDRPAVARGMCKSHYNRWQYSGSAVPKRRERLCSCCGNAFEVKRSSQQFCSDVCRLRYFRRRKREPCLLSIRIRRCMSFLWSLWRKRLLFLLRFFPSGMCGRLRAAYVMCVGNRRRVTCIRVMLALLRGLFRRSLVVRAHCRTV